MPVKSNCNKSENHLFWYLIECFTKKKKKKNKMVPEIKFSFKTCKIFIYRFQSWQCSIYMINLNHQKIVVVQSPSCVQLFCNPMNCRMPGFCPLSQWYHLILWCPFLLLPSIFPSIRVFFFFQWASSLHQVAKVLDLSHQSLQWIFRVYFL